MSNILTNKEEIEIPYKLKLIDDRLTLNKNGKYNFRNLYFFKKNPFELINILKIQINSLENNQKEEYIKNINFLFNWWNNEYKYKLDIIDLIFKILFLDLSPYMLFTLKLILEKNKKLIEIYLCKVFLNNLNVKKLRGLEPHQFEIVNFLQLKISKEKYRYLNRYKEALQLYPIDKIISDVLHFIYFETLFK
ncbi:hypothetical protein NPA08_04180 [Mycoplasmopsis citelli]|uniref:hypothetical protein n=1 Tax=Mycoplasmopsis citelli TaxID=171281 RepID=UPI0021155000|nr:hypothetical protein [Mycoplasmopsis citelli]UUD36119.1 hypothetical protein NPA08_04180 [Mycoplasmopsis citelli]